MYAHRVEESADQLHMLAWAAHMNARQIEESVKDLPQDASIEGECLSLETDLRRATEALAAVTVAQHKILKRLTANGSLARVRPVRCHGTENTSG